MPSPEQQAARARVRELEANPKHSGHDPVAAEHTKVDRLDDPKHQGKPDQDPRWHQPPGHPEVWSHPDFDD